MIDCITYKTRLCKFWCAIVVAWFSFLILQSLNNLCRKKFILEEHTLTMCLSVFDKVLCSCSSAIDSAKESASYVVMSFKTLSVEFELYTFCSRNFLLRFPCLSDFSSAIPRDLLEFLLSCMWDPGHESNPIASWSTNFWKVVMAFACRRSINLWRLLSPLVSRLHEQRRIAHNYDRSGRPKILLHTCTEILKYQTYRFWIVQPPKMSFLEFYTPSFSIVFSGP